MYPENIVPQAQNGLFLRPLFQLLTPSVGGRQSGYVSVLVQFYFSLSKSLSGKVGSCGVSLPSSVENTVCFKNCKGSRSKRTREVLIWLIQTLFAKERIYLQTAKYATICFPLLFPS